MAQAQGTSDALPYPPPQHLLRDLRMDVDVSSDRTARARLPVVDEIRTDTGTVTLGVVATMVDILAGALAAVCVMPDWMATSDLAVHLARLGLPETVHATARVLHQGSKTIVIGVDLDDEHHETLGSASLSFAVLPRRAVNPKLDASGPQQMTLKSDDVGFERPILDQIGLRIVDADAGDTSTPMEPYVQNSFGALQGGAVALLADAAAQAAMRARSGAPLVTCDLQLTYLEMGRAGPFRTSAEIHESSHDHGAARVTVFDEGQDDLRMAIARARSARAR